MQNLITKIFILLLLCLFCNIANSQEGGYLYGTVLDYQNNPISGVVLSVNNLEFTTKNDGFFYFERISPGIKELLAKRGNKTLTEVIQINPKQHLEHNIFWPASNMDSRYKNELNIENHIIKNVGVNTYATFSPNSGEIAIEVFDIKTKGFDIWLINSAGKKIKEIISTPEDDGNPRWSPDGMKIVYQTYSKIQSYRIWVKNLQTNTSKLIDYGLTPAWSPDGNNIVYAKYVGGNCDIYVRNLNTGITDRLTDHSDKDQYPFWGKIKNVEKIVFASRKTGIYEIWIMNVDGSKKTQLTTIGNSLGNRLVGPVISPDGNKIAFWEIDYTNDHSVWIMESDGSNPIELLKHAANPEWSPLNPKILYFDSKITGRAQIWKTSIQ